MLKISLQSNNRAELQREIEQLKKIYDTRMGGLKIEQGRNKPGWFAYGTIEPLAVTTTLDSSHLASADERWQATLAAVQAQEQATNFSEIKPTKAGEKANITTPVTVADTVNTSIKSTPIAASSGETKFKQKKAALPIHPATITNSETTHQHPVQQILNRLLLLKEAATWVAEHHSEFGLVSAPKYDAMKNACHSGELKAVQKGEYWYTTPAKVAKYLQNYAKLQNVPKRLGGKSALAASGEETGNVAVQSNIQDYDDLDLEHLFKRLLTLSEASDWTGEHLQDYGLKRPISTGTLQDAAQEGRLTAFQKSKVWFTDKSDLENYVRNFNQQAHRRASRKLTATQRKIRQLERKRI